MKVERHELVRTLACGFGADWAGLTDTERAKISHGFDESSGHIEAYVRLGEISERIVKRIIARYRTYDNYFDRTNGVWVYDITAAFFDAVCVHDMDDEKAIDYAIVESLIPSARNESAIRRQRANA